MEAVSEREEAASCSAGEEITESQMMDSCERTQAQNFMEREVHWYLVLLNMAPLL